MHPFQKHREQKASHARVKTILKADGGQAGKPSVGDAKFMMAYDKNAGGQKMKSDMAEAQRISDAVPRNRKED